MRSRLTRFALATSLVCTVVACQTPAPEGAKKDTPTTPDLKSEPTAGTPVTAGNATAASGAATVAGGSAATAADTAATAGTVTAPGSAGAPETTAPAAEPTPTTGPDEGATPPAATPVDKAKLLGEAKSKKTSDARAKKALEEAEAGGATARELAEASNARGLALLAEAERAQAAFEWARDKDPTYPDASFNLAKQTANAGEIPATVAHLKEVHKRGGKTLLKQVGYDPTFEIVKDDPEVAKIVK